ncbi:CPBP family intramembrane glutamic endopeptidase [Planctomyces sp. SH-PL62]|uniref:CPBP family intramembrane glutamic endopeptidase n=1 Tax=Planctomyces sp. SH-PL62 TaxID=1636152 RepID=UPI00078D5C0D|nr:CPBP family intramembrane glutamic endopeptidase [Planctomyces sp. SH-PL62]AMV39309.1 CAAX amino terminal protease self- immunity [Planctomyces sp. SH-PL62]
MTPVSILEFLLSVTSTFLELILVGMVVSWGWVLIRLARGLPLIPTEPFLQIPPARWGLGTILLVVILQLGAGRVAAEGCHALLGFKVEELLTTENPKPAPPTPDGEMADDEDAEEIAIQRSASIARRLMIWNASYNGLFLLAFPWLFRLVSGAGFAALGFTTRRWTEQLQVGIVAGLLAAPVVYSIQFLAVKVFEVRAHPIEKMLQASFDPALAILAMTSTIVLAPLAEEVMFRGVLQGWLTRVWNDQIPRLMRGGRQAQATPMAEGAVVGPTAPEILQTTVESPGPQAPNAVCWPAVIVTSAVFAAVHGPQWPAPIALFVFSMVMGAVYQRTGSLLSAIVIHGLFNGCSTLLLIVQQLGRSLELPDPTVLAPAPAPAVAWVWESLVRLLS